MERATLNLNIADKRRKPPTAPTPMPMQTTRTNFDVLIRILDAPTSFAATDDDDVSSVLTEDERVRLREVITHDVHIKKFLQVTNQPYNPTQPNPI